MGGSCARMNVVDVPVSQSCACDNWFNSSCPGKSAKRVFPLDDRAVTSLKRYRSNARKTGTAPGEDKADMTSLAKPSISDERSARLAGIGLMLFGVFMFSFGDALGKFMVATYSVGQLLWLRACAALLLLLPMIWKQRAAFASLERPWLQLLRVTLSTIEVAAFFLATVYLPLADVITYYLACPIIVTALSWILLREKIGWRRWSAVLIGFCGVLIALRPSSQPPR